MSEATDKILADAKRAIDEAKGKVGIVIAVGDDKGVLILGYENTAGFVLAARTICNQIESSHVYGRCGHCDKAAKLALRAADALADLRGPRDDCR